MSNISIKPDKDSLLDYIKRFQEGKIQVPAFQRDLVWKDNQKIELLESIEKGYPIGSILLWKPDFQQDEALYKFESKTIGSYTIPSKNNDFFYIVDGFQRLSTLFGCLINPHKTDLERDGGKWKKEFNIVYNLEAEEGEYNFELPKRELTDLEHYKIPIYKLIDPKDFFSFQKKIYEIGLAPEKVESYLEKYENVSKAIQKYELPSINIYGGTLSEAVDIFQRLNSRGTDMSPDWIVSALSFNKDKGFKLGVEIDKLLKDISIYNFQSQKRSVILNCITNSFKGVYFDMASKGKKLEELARRDDFADVTRKTIISIESAVQFLFEKLLTLHKKLLPYNSQLIFITDFFSKIENPTQSQLETLKNWFWITTYSNYFTRYNLSKQRTAYSKFQAFIEDENQSPVYYDNKEHTFETLEFPDKINMGSVRAKALALFMLNHQIKDTNLDTDILNGYKTHELFKTEGNISENTILVIDDGSISIPKSQKDLSYWLNSSEDHTRFFITQEMKNEYKNDASSKSILAKRKELILQSEREFVKSFGLRYIEKEQDN